MFTNDERYMFILLLLKAFPTVGGLLGIPTRKPQIMRHVCCGSFVKNTCGLWKCGPDLALGTSQVHPEHVSALRLDIGATGIDVNLLQR